MVPIFKNYGDPSVLVKHLTLHGLYFSSSSSDVLMVITEFVYQALDKNSKAWAVALHILKAFNRVWHAGLLHKLKGYRVSGQIFDVTQFVKNN